MSKRIAIIMILAAFVAFLTSSPLAVAGKYDLAGEKYKDSSEGAWLGVYLQDINPDLREALDLKSKEGALVAGVVEDSPAEEAGIEEEDVVVELDGRKISSTSQLTRLIKKHSPGDEITLKLVREGQDNTITVILGKPPKGGRTMPKTFFGDLGVPGHNYLSLAYFSGNRIGVKVQSLSEQLGQYFGVEDGEGVLITEVEEDMPAKKAGLKAGDVIVAADGEEVYETGDLVEIISEKEEGEKVKIDILRDHKSMTFEVEVEEGALWSSKGDDLAKVKIFSDQLHQPESFWFQEHSSDLKEEMEELKNELGELKKELQELRDKLR